MGAHLVAILVSILLWEASANINLVMDLTRLDEAEANATFAVCNDGSPAGYYFREGSDRWVIHLQGGAWCYDNATCQNRWDTLNYLMTAKDWHPQISLRGIFNQNPTWNPVFHDATFLYIPYCTSDSFTGNSSRASSGLEWEFRGKAVLTHIINHALDALGLDTAEEVLLNGCSAGGAAVVANIDYVASLLPNTTKFKGHADAGFFLDSSVYQANQWNPTGARMSEWFELGQPLWDGTPDASCAAAYPSEVFKCYMAQYAHQYISTPVLFHQNKYDDWQLVILNGADFRKPSNQDFVRSWRQNMTTALEAVEAPHSVFAPNFWLHCISENDNFLWLMLANEYPHLNNANALTMFFIYDAEGGVWADDLPFLTPSIDSLYDHGTIYPPPSIGTCLIPGAPCTDAAGHPGTCDGSTCGAGGMPGPDLPPIGPPCSPGGSSCSAMSPGVCNEDNHCVRVNLFVCESSGNPCMSDDGTSGFCNDANTCVPCADGCCVAGMFCPLSGSGPFSPPGICSAGLECIAGPNMPAPPGDPFVCLANNDMCIHQESGTCDGPTGFCVGSGPGHDIPSSCGVVGMPCFTSRGPGTCDGKRCTHDTAPSFDVPCVPDAPCGLFAPGICTAALECKQVNLTDCEADGDPCFSPSFGGGFCTSGTCEEPTCPSNGCCMADFPCITAAGTPGQCDSALACQSIPDGGLPPLPPAPPRAGTCAHANDLCIAILNSGMCDSTKTCKPVAPTSTTAATTAATTTGMSTTAGSSSATTSLTTAASSTACCGDENSGSLASPALVLVFAAAVSIFF